MTKSIANKSTGRFIAIPFVVLKSEDYCDLNPYAAKLLNLMLMQYNGNNNGEIFLSHRDAAIALHVHRNTVGPWFKLLEERGFIHLTRAPHLGPSGVGRASTWALAEARTMDGGKASMAFKKWRIPA